MNGYKSAANHHLYNVERYVVVQKIAATQLATANEVRLVEFAYS